MDCPCLLDYIISRFHCTVPFTHHFPQKIPSSKYVSLWYLFLISAMWSLSHFDNNNGLLSFIPYTLYLKLAPSIVKVFGSVGIVFPCFYFLTLLFNPLQSGFCPDYISKFLSVLGSSLFCSTEKPFLTIASYLDGIWPCSLHPFW